MEDAGRSKAPIPVLSANTLKRGTMPVEMGGRNYGHAETYLTAYGARHDSMCWCSVLEGCRSSDGGKTPNLCMFVLDKNHGNAMDIGNIYRKCSLWTLYMFFEKRSLRILDILYAMKMGGQNYGHAETYLTAYGARHDSMCWCSVLEGSRSSDGRIFVDFWF
ncbi:hypothetical protein CDAR_201681 [Caerostris darwini]|uniref:Uncharacterized protein n=1 Tax=Caerostris darwini TaxID=1538125 RepID=A0AAV4QGE7_9ARAC|nr:hypothetical protein CDAR_201681 [Caerostris darwini]